MLANAIIHLLHYEESLLHVTLVSLLPMFKQGQIQACSLTCQWLPKNYYQIIPCAIWPVVLETDFFFI